MDSIYLISLIVGGFFVLLSIFGAGEHDSETDFDHDFDHDVDFDHDMDFDSDADFDSDLSIDVDSGPDFVDLLSIRALFLFAAFFGLTGVLLTMFGTGEPLVASLSTVTGLLVGLGGNWIIKKFAYEQVSSQVSDSDMKGRTAKVLLPFEGDENGKILLKAGGKKMQVTARLFESGEAEAVRPGDQVVVIRMDGRIAEVVRPD